MEHSDLLLIVADLLEQLQIPYFVTGSMASIVYGEARFTNDIDIVIRIDARDGAALGRVFAQPDYYISEAAVDEAARRHTQFNVIHPASGWKIDFMVAGPDAFDASRFQRVQPVEVVEGRFVRFASPEDVILKKLVFFKEGGSDKHLRDIRGILKLSGQSIDNEYLAQWVSKLGVHAEWELVGDGA
jgi:hypothetical protein